MGRSTVAIVVHGGAWSIPPEAREPHARGCLAAAERGFAVLEAAGSAVEAVVTAIELLEDDPTFDAGRGSVLSAEGRVQLDAGLMDGRTLHVGAVAGVHRVAHPIRLARAVLERSSHHLLVGEGAERFAHAQGIPLVDPDSLIVDRERQRYADFLAGRLGAADDFAHDTVGAVALDAGGQLAAGNSTGGVAFSLPGRVGDAPVPGVGYVADSRTGGVACTGWGEQILRVGLATRALVAMERGAAAQDAAAEALEVLERAVQGRAGLIVLDRRGEVGLAHSTLCLAHAYRRSGMPEAVGGTEAVRR
ncbi:MAG: peptidase T [Myxococcaceae bacterium]|nr:MAG: peptidase T [Myxococcaceae bacterium]